VRGSIAESAGIQVGDIIVSVDGTAVRTVNEFIEAIHEGDRTKMICLRADGEEKTVDVEFPERSEQEVSQPCRPSGIDRTGFASTK
jgi:S1-C subfamily serine protease